MLSRTEPENVKRRPINLTIREDIIAEAKEYNLNASKAAEEGIRAALKEEKEQRWREENRVAIEAHNARIEREGTIITPIWLREDDGAL